MELELKSDAEQARKRIDAFWHGEILDRPCIKVLAPRHAIPQEVVPVDQLESHWLDPERVIGRLRRQLEATFFGGEAFPVMFPMSTGIPAILAAYFGCPVRFVNTDTGWAEPILHTWGSRKRLAFNPDSAWWLKTVSLFRAAGADARGHYHIGLPDLNGPGEAVARLRGSEALAVDLIDNLGEVQSAVAEAVNAWYEYFQACHHIVHEYVGGWFYWMGIWSDEPSTDLQRDFSCMISPEMFRRFFLPGIELQTRLVPRTIYHLDGPGAVRHLDALLELPRLTGIQWVPGAGSPRMSTWIPLLRRIQATGKLLFLSCEPDEVETLFTELRPQGVLLQTHCKTVAEAQALLARVAVLPLRRP